MTITLDKDNIKIEYDDGSVITDSKNELIKERLEEFKRQLNISLECCFGDLKK